MCKKMQEIGGVGFHPTNIMNYFYYFIFNPPDIGMILFQIFKLLSVTLKLKQQTSNFPKTNIMCRSYI